MPVLLVKGLSQAELKSLKRLKVDLDARTWRELLLKLAELRSEVLREATEQNPERCQFRVEVQNPRKEVRM